MNRYNQLTLTNQVITPMETGTEERINNGNI